MPDQSPADVLRAAASLMRERAGAATSPDWPDRPWQVTECAGQPGDPRDGCPCIVYQGEYGPDGHAQSPLIQYVADAEAAEFAAYIASMHPGVALAVADWLDAEAERAERPGSFALHSLSPGPLAIARAYLGETDD
jgi:hypothetical protein